MWQKVWLPATGGGRERWCERGRGGVQLFSKQPHPGWARRERRGRGSCALPQVSLLPRPSRAHPAELSGAGRCWEGSSELLHSRFQHRGSGRFRGGEEYRLDLFPMDIDRLSAHTSARLKPKTSNTKKEVYDHFRTMGGKRKGKKIARFLIIPN